MARVRRIDRNPREGMNHFVVDASFLVNRAIPLGLAPAGREQTRIQTCLDWWAEIDAQLKSGDARVYVPDICIAESFKVLARKYYVDKWFATPVAYNNARRRLHGFISTPSKVLKAAYRQIKVHDISTTRDIIISVDRFYEAFHKANLSGVSVPDLLVVATAKYLIDFYDVPKQRLHIVTLDQKLRAGSRKLQEVPTAYDPTESADAAAKIFRTAP